MKFSTTAGALRNALSQARTAISAKPNLLARGGAHISATKGGSKPVRITGSNDQVTIMSAVADAKVEENGTVLVTPGPLQGFLATLREDLKLEVETTNTHLVVTREGGAPYRFVPMHADYPDPPTVRGTKAAVNFSRLDDAVDAVKRSTGEEGVVQLTSDDKNLTLASTDNYRLSQVVIANAGFGEYTGILQLSAVDRVARAKPAAVNYDKKAVNVVTDDVSITIRALANASFPDVSTALDQAPKNTITIPRLELVQALQRLNAVDAEATVALAIDQTSLTITLSESPSGHGQEDLDITGGPSTLFIVSVNLKFLLDTALSHKGDEILFGFSGPTEILFIRSTDSDIQVTSAVMPVAGPTT